MRFFSNRNNAPQSLLDDAWFVGGANIFKVSYSTMSVSECQSHVAFEPRL